MQNTWDVETLNKLRQQMDPQADEAISAIYSSQAGGELRDALMKLARNDEFNTSNFFAGAETPQALHDLIDREMNRKFSEEDLRMFNRTFELWRQYGVQFIFVLFFRALPYTYAAEKPANVLRMTRLLEEQPTRRIFETAQFVFDVMEQRWWEPNQRGILTALKIRLMHAAIRYMLLNKDGGEKWDEQQWGKPISQEDLIATNQVFSLEFFKGLEIVDNPMPAEDQAAWFHTWKVIGSIMGIQDELLRPTVAEAWDIQISIYRHLFHDVNYAGVGLAKSLVETLKQFLLSEKMILLIMKRMMKDDENPEAFLQMLGPTYGHVHAQLFMKSRSTDEEDALEAQLQEEFMEELKTYADQVKAYRNNELKDEPATRGERTDNLVDFQIREFDDILAEYAQNTTSRGLLSDFKDTVIKKAFSAVAAVAIDILSKYFRQGKRAGFRISADLRDHWSLN